ncbi:hypothetical protein JD79_02514 [Geodermatophilus normandii]|uniref:Uncharacterized protein n=1 Tax=Geodermatophilus normandii TaxID=1137989 RepID=A0A317QP11_9ACTN|nr:hypothetical protein [Geodermatophilus normandii]PWW23340.1 hypothetical protein JD79_02514 [Geodermatophilus normandii]
MDTALRPVVPPLPSMVRLPDGQVDVAQDFVNRLRAAAPQFAVAAGAGSAVVREAVPPARHRRARCRVVLRHADGGERDLTFLGPVSRPAVVPDRTFEQQIQQWLAARIEGEGEWLVADDEAPAGVAVDLTAWTGRPASAGLPTQAMPLQAVPTRTVPSDGVRAVPSDGVRAEGLATQAMPAQLAAPLAG